MSDEQEWYGCVGSVVGCDAEFTTNEEREQHEYGCDLFSIAYHALFPGWMVDNPVWLIATTGKAHRPHDDQTRLYHDEWRAACGRVLTNPRTVHIDSPTASLPRIEDVCKRCGDWDEDSHMAQVIKCWKEHS